MIFKRIERLEKFNKDLKKLLKKFPSLEGDLLTLVNTSLYAYHKLNVDNHGIHPIENLGIECPKIYKVKKFACKALKGSGIHSGIRVIYAYFPEEDRIELVELYYKGEKGNEDRERIKNCYD